MNKKEIKGNFTEIIDSVLDEEENFNQEMKFRKTTDWKNLNYKINKNNNSINYDFENQKNSEEDNILLTELKTIKLSNNNNNNNIKNLSQSIKIDENNKILNENLFKGKGFRSNREEFFENQKDLLNTSGITDISTLSTTPNVYQCAIPRPGTSRYKRATKTVNINLFENLKKKK